MKLKVSALQNFAQVLLEEFGIQKLDTITLNLAELRRVVDAEVSYRKGVEQMAGGSAAATADIEEQPSEGKCIVS